MKQQHAIEMDRCEWLGPLRFSGHQAKCGAKAVRFYRCSDGTVQARCKGHMPPGIIDVASHIDWINWKIVKEVMEA